MPTHHHSPTVNCITASLHHCTSHSVPEPPAAVNNNEQICRICYRQPFVVLNAAQLRSSSGRLGAGLGAISASIPGPTADWRGARVDHFGVSARRWQLGILLSPACPVAPPRDPPRDPRPRGQNKLICRQSAQLPAARAGSKTRDGTAQAETAQDGTGRRSKELGDQPGGDRPCTRSRTFITVPCLGVGSSTQARGGGRC